MWVVLPRAADLPVPINNNSVTSLMLYPLLRHALFTLEPERAHAGRERLDGLHEGGGRDEHGQDVVGADDVGPGDRGRHGCRS